MTMLPMEPRPRRGIFGRGFDLPDPSPQPQMAMQAPRLGFTDRLGMAGDILAGDNRTGDRINQDMEPYRRAAQLQQQQAAQWEMWQRQQQWQRDNPAPANNDTVNDYNFIAERLGVEAANQYLRNIGDPTVTVPLGENRIYAGPRSGLGPAMSGSGATPPPSPVGKLKPIGGASPSGSRTFPLR